MQTNRFVAFALCAALPLFSIAACAKEKPLQVSKENFVSLNWSRSQTLHGGDFGGKPVLYSQIETYTFENQSIQHNASGGFGGGGGGVGGGVGGVFPPYPQPSFSVVVPMSQNQWGDLLARLKKLDLPSIAGDYELKFSRRNETLVLTMSDENNVDQTFVISTAGNRAPASYAKFSAYLATLIARKFPTPPQPKAATSPAPISPK